MKIKLLLPLLCCCILNTAPLQAQLPDGSFVPNFEATDINGETHNLYDLLSQGYRIVIDMMATWCTPCWDYHETDALKELHELYGPDGTGEIFVMMVEGDDWNTPEDLDGTGTYTEGNWIEGVDYAIIDNGGFIARLLEINGYPTIYTICPNGKIYDSGPKTAAEHYDFAMSLNCQSVPMDAAIQSKPFHSVCHQNFNTQVVLINAGTDVLNNASVTMEGCDDCPITKEFNGALEHFQYTTINFEGIEESTSQTDLSYTLNTPDANPENDQSISLITIGTVPAYETWEIELFTDCFPHESSWTIEDEYCNIIAKGIGYDEKNTLYKETVQLPAAGCYTLTLRDRGQDGLNGAAQNNCTLNGYFSATSSLGSVYFTDGTDQFSQIKANGDVTFAVNTKNDFIKKENILIAPNPANDFIKISIDELIVGELKINITDITGQHLQSYSFKKTFNFFETSIDISSLSNGIYFVQLISDGKLYNKKVIHLH